MSLHNHTLRTTTRPPFCADDWGLSPSINTGILELAERGLVRRVSLLANGPYLEHKLERLLQLSKKKEIFLSLHLNLTEGQPIALKSRKSHLINPMDKCFYSLLPLLKRCYLIKLSHAEIYEESEAQLEALIQLKIPVSGIDGHHHVHLLPQVSKVLERLVLRKGLSSFRIMIDPEHKGSYWATHFFLKRHQKSAYKNFESTYAPTLYLRERLNGTIDLVNDGAFLFAA